MNSPGYQESVARSKNYEITSRFSITKSYRITLSNQSGTNAAIDFPGQYDDSRPWYEQNNDEFANETRDAQIGRSQGMLRVLADNGYHTEYHINFPILDANAIKCRDMFDDTECSFPYTTAGSGKDMTVTIDVKGASITPSWVPSSEIPGF